LISPLKQFLIPAVPNASIAIMKGIPKTAYSHMNGFAKAAEVASFRGN
jgi:hypothetical protein